MSQGVTEHKCSAAVNKVEKDKHKGLESEFRIQVPELDKQRTILSRSIVVGMIDNGTKHAMENKWKAEEDLIEAD